MAFDSLHGGEKNMGVILTTYPSPGMILQEGAL